MDEMYSMIYSVRMDTFPPPHRILYEPLNDRATLELVAAYTAAHQHEADVETVDAAHMNSMDDFAKWVTQWMAFAPTRPSIRCRLLVVWHAHLLSLACQQMLRRSLEQRSFRCRLWFHIEEPTIQAALVSRCIVTRIPGSVHRPLRVGPPIDCRLWTDPRVYEMELQETT
jgi:hypothetical protein